MKGFPADLAWTDIPPVVDLAAYTSIPRATPTIADIDLDGDLEIIKFAGFGCLMAFDAPAGTTATGWPIKNYDMGRTSNYGL